LTGRSIPLARLQALPYTTVCVEAQRELEETGEAETEGADWGRVLDTEPATAEDVLPISDLDF
jgi:DnaK suppressor protein